MWQRRGQSLIIILAEPGSAAYVGPAIASARVDLLLQGKWPAGVVTPEDLAPVVSDIPTLIMGGEFDPNAAPDDMVQLASTLKNSHTFLLPWLGHSVTGYECAHQMIRAFFDDPSQPPDST